MRSDELVQLAPPDGGDVAEADARDDAHYLRYLDDGAPTAEEDALGQAAALLGPDGPFARQPNYEARPAQQQMAALVERALREGRHAAIEAATGTGKSLAYLVAAVAAGTRGSRGRPRVLVATATKALQAQLATHDVPQVEQALGRPVRVQELKGRGNYVCRLRLQEVRQRLRAGSAHQGVFPTLAAVTAWPAVDAWCDTTPTGDVETYPGADGLLPELRGLLTVDAECLGAKCPQVDDCHANEARRQAELADVVVTNLHLLVRDRWVRERTNGRATLLPDADLIVLDEAHALEGITTDALGIDVTRYRWQRLAQAMLRLTAGHPLSRPQFASGDDGGERAWWPELGERWASLLADQTAELTETLAALRAQLAAGASSDEGQGTAPADDGQPAPVAARLLDDHARAALLPVARGATFLSRFAETVPPWLVDTERLTWGKLAEQAARLAEDLALLAAPAEGGTVSFAELDAPPNGRGAPSVRLRSVPAEVASWLAATLFAARVPVVATSATLAVAGTLASWRSRVGMDAWAPPPPPDRPEAPRRAPLATLEQITPQTFAWDRRALLYLPPAVADLVPPAGGWVSRMERDAYLDRLAGQVEALVLLARPTGGAFVLTTSASAMRALYERLQAPLTEAGALVLWQGSGQRKDELLQRFTQDSHAVLFATRSFWQGVDVPGPALSLVIIDKVPFPVPSDPVWAARKAAHEQRRRGKSFMELWIPEAAILLKQGVGRLLRARTDYGVVAILDGRLGTARYASALLQSLPAMPRTTRLDDVRAFFAVATDARRVA